MKCPNCNFDVTQPTKFCPECGTKLPEELNETVAPATPQSAAEQEATPAKKPKKSKKKLILIISISVACLAVLAGAFFILRAINPGCMFGHKNLSNYETITKPTCQEAGVSKRTCLDCGEVFEYSMSDTDAHQYQNIVCGVSNACTLCGAKTVIEHQTENYEDKECKHCGQALVSIEFPEFPYSVHCYDLRGNIEQSITITKWEAVYNSGSTYCEIKYNATRTYHKNGANYSANGKFAWKLYDADGTVVDSGTEYTDATIEMGEASKGEFTILELEKWHKYRLEIIHLS